MIHPTERWLPESNPIMWPYKRSRPPAPFSGPTSSRTSQTCFDDDKEDGMATVSFNRQPGNPGAYDLHAYYGGTGSPNPHGTPHGHGHLHIQNGQTIYHRMPVERGLGQIAVGGRFHP